MKSLAKNSLFNVTYKCTSVIFPLLMAAYVSRILSPDGVGRVASAQNIVTYFTILAALGLPTYGTKIISATKSSKELNRAFNELFIINVFSTTFCWIAYYTLIFTFSYFQGQRNLYCVTGLLIIFNYINVDWFYQGKEEYRYIMVRSLVVRFFSLLAVFLFVRTPEDYIIYALVLTLSKAANYIFNIYNLRKVVSFSFANINIKQHIKPVFVLLAASLAIEIYTLADTTMLSVMCGARSVGYYSTAVKSISVAKMLITSTIGVFLPRLSYYFAHKDMKQFITLVNRGFKLLLLLTIPAAIGVFLIADQITIILYGAEFAVSAVTTRILSLSIITVGFSNFIGYQILVTIKKEKLMFYSTLVGAVVNVALNYFMIRAYAQNGAAIASVITELCVTCVQLLFIKKIVAFHFCFAYIRSLLVSNVAMIVCVLTIHRFVTSTVFSLICSLVIGMTSYFVVGLLSKNELLLQGLDRIKKYGID